MDGYADKLPADSCLTTKMLSVDVFHRLNFAAVILYLQYQHALAETLQAVHAASIS